MAMVQSFMNPSKFKDFHQVILSKSKARSRKTNLKCQIKSPAFPAVTTVNLHMEVANNLSMPSSETSLITRELFKTLNLICKATQE